MPVAPGTYRYILAELKWETAEDGFSYWRHPDGALGGVDLRSLPQQAIEGGTPQGSGFFVLADPNAPLDSGWTDLGTDLDGALAAAQVSEAETRLNLPGQPSSNILLSIGAEVLTTFADPTGQDRVRPIMPTVAGVMEWHLPGHSPVWRERFDPVKHPRVLEVVRLNYRAVREAALRGEMRSAGRVDREFHRKYLDYQSDKLRVPWETLIPADLPRERPLPRETTIGDTFVEAGPGNIALADHTATGPNGGFAWTDVLANIVVVSADDEIGNGVGSNANSRAESDLSGDDMYADSDITTKSATDTQNHGGVVRFNASAESFYVMLLRERADAQYRLFKFTTGTPSQIGSSVTEALPTAPFTARTNIDGSSLSGLVDSVTKIGPETDTSFTGQTRAGVLMGSGWRASDWEAADLAVGGRVMGALAGHGGLAGAGGIAGRRGGIAG